MGTRHFCLKITLLTLLLGAAFALNILFGSVDITSMDRAAAWKVLLLLRAPRALLAVFAGAALAVSGAAFQGLFRNPLADPYVIGASSGAALGAALALVFSLPAIGLLPGPAWAAFFGALGATFAAFAISRFAGNPPPAAALLLAGTALSSLFSALLTLLLVVKDQDLHRVYYWLLGSLGSSGWNELALELPLMAVGMAVIFFSGRPLDLLAAGEETASSMGLNVKASRLLIASGAVLATASSVGAAGIIGFVGLIAPHLARFIAGPSYRRLAPVSALLGALLLLVSDLLSRLLLSPLELPIGVVTSCLGAPFFLFLLVRRGRSLGAS